MTLPRSLVQASSAYTLARTLHDAPSGAPHVHAEHVRVLVTTLQPVRRSVHPSGHDTATSMSFATKHSR